VADVRNAVFKTAGVWDELEVWEEEPQFLEALASLAGEAPAVFRSSLPERVNAIVRAYLGVGYLIGPSARAEAAIKRIAMTT
jgi:hypothetical protein